MANDQTVAPVIIKRKKIIAADGHHGAATLTLESGETIAPKNVIALR